MSESSSFHQVVRSTEKSLLGEELFVLTSQFWRAANWLSLNIVEGNGNINK
jgi:hypothetical protein